MRWRGSIRRLCKAIKTNRRPTSQWLSMSLTKTNTTYAPIIVDRRTRCASKNSSKACGIDAKTNYTKSWTRNLRRFKRIRRRLVRHRQSVSDNRWICRTCHLKLLMKERQAPPKRQLRKRRVWNPNSLTKNEISSNIRLWRKREFKTSPNLIWCKASK